MQNDKPPSSSPTRRPDKAPAGAPDTLRNESDADMVAASAAAIWRDVQAALAPIVGERGVAALYKRSLHLACGDHPWLNAAFEDDVPLLFDALRRALAQRTAAEAAAGHGALLQLFHDLLTSLIGSSLTERLLGSPPVVNFSSGAAAQDSLP